MNFQQVDLSCRSSHISLSWCLCECLYMTEYIVISTERAAAAVCREVIMSELFSGSILSISRENDLQTDVPPAGIHQGLTENCNGWLCHRLGSLPLMLMIFALKWPPIIVFFLLCLPDVISPAKWRAWKRCIRAFTGSDCETGLKEVAKKGVGRQNMKITSSFVLNGQRKKWCSNSRWKRVIMTVEQSMQFFHMCGVIRIPADSVHHVTSLMSCRMPNTKLIRRAIHEVVKPAALYLFIYLKHQPVTLRVCSRSVETTAALPAPQTQLSYWTTGTFLTRTEMRPVLKQPKCLKSQTALCSSCLNSCAWHSPPGIWGVHFYPKLIYKYINLIVDGLPFVSCGVYQGQH